MKSILMLLLAFSTQSFAETMNNMSRRDIIIRPIEHNSNKLEYKEGENAHFEGEICAVSEGFLKNGREQCRQLNGNLEIKAFFPDPTVDVTDKVKITKRSQSYHYSYTTPDLKAGEGNALTLLVGPVSDRTKKLLVIKAKLDRRIDYLQKRILKYELTSKHPFYLEFLLSLKNKLETVSDKIQGLLDKENIVISKLIRPLQIESDTPTVFYYHSIFDEKILSLSIPEGLPRIGTFLTIDAKVTHLKNQDIKKKSHNESFQLKLLIDEKVVHVSERLSKAEIETFRFSHSLTDHKEGVPRRLILELYSVKDIGHGKNFKTNYDLAGKLELVLPAPLPRVDKVPPMIELALEDNLRLSNNKVLLTGTIADDSDAGYAIFLNNQLLFENDTKVINRELSLSQGINIIKVKAQDIWGNISEVSRTVNVDSIDPIILSNQNFITLTNQMQLLIQAQILESNDVSTRILHNGQEVFTSNMKLIVYSLNLFEGQNSIRIESIDSFGNVAVPFEASGIVLDTTPPVINFSHAPTIPNPDQEITVDASATVDSNGINKYSVLASNALLTTSSGSLLKFKIQNSGDHQITLKAEDNAGNSAFLVKTIYINRAPIASLIANPSSGSAPLIVELDASASSDEAALMYHFDFGDGSPVLVTSSSKTTHEYRVGTYNASVKVVDQNGLEAVSVTKIDATEVPTEAIPQIHIVTKNNFKLHSNYLKGEIIELDASYSKGGVGEIVKYEWKRGEETIGREVNVILPNTEIGTQEYSLTITNSNNLSAKKDFSISISPQVVPEITIAQSSIYAPSQVTISLVNSNDFIGVKKYPGETYTQWKIFLPKLSLKPSTMLVKQNLKF